MNGSSDVLKRGILGGVLAATAIVLFFLFVDVMQGETLRTPTFLASVLLGQEQTAIGIGFVAVYTVIHYAVFAALGVGVAWAVDRAHAPPSILLGLVLGVLLFDLVFYAGVILTGTNVVSVIGWPSFLAGNLLGGVTLMAYLAQAGPEASRSWAETLAEHQVLREGVIAGVIGALAVAAWLFVVDLGTGRLLYTPAALGSALFMGVNAPEAVQVTASNVLGYTGVHFVGFIAMGMVFAALITRAEQSPPLLMGLALLFVTFETLLLGLVAILAVWLLDVLPWWSIALSNLVAAAAMVFYLWRAHPALADLDWADPDTPAAHRTKADGGG